MLVIKGSNPNEGDQHGDRPVHDAASAGHADCIVSLVGLGANVDVQNNDGKTPLHLAVTRTEPNAATVVSKLIDVGALTNIRDKEGYKPVQLANKIGNHETEAILNIQNLSQAGAQVGELEIALHWYNYNDLDLTVICPHGTRIFYRQGHRKASCCEGELDVDMNVNPTTDDAGEHVRWPDGKTPNGIYSVYVVYYRNHAERWDPKQCKDPTPFNLGIKSAGEPFCRMHGGISNDEKLTTPEGDKYEIGKPHIIACTFKWTRGKGPSDFVAHPSLKVQDLCVPPPQPAPLTKY